MTRVPCEKTRVAFENAIRIFNDNDSVDKYNVEKLIDLKKPIIQITASNSNPKSKSGSQTEFGGLVNAIYLSVDCNVTLITNTWIKKGNCHFYF